MKIGRRLNGQHDPVEVKNSDIGPAHRGRPYANGEAASLGARLSEILSQETPDDLLARLGEFKRSVEEALKRSSSAFQILRQLEESGLKDCARCTRELEERLAGNPHYLVLSKIEEAEKLLSQVIAVQL